MRENTVSIPGISVDTGLAFHPGNLGFEFKTIAQEHFLFSYDKTRT